MQHSLQFLQNGHFYKNICRCHQLFQRFLCILSCLNHPILKNLSWLSCKFPRLLSLTGSMLPESCLLTALHEIWAVSCQHVHQLRGKFYLFGQICIVIMQSVYFARKFWVSLTPDSNQRSLVSGTDVWAEEDFTVANSLLTIFSMCIVLLSGELYHFRNSDHESWDNKDSFAAMPFNSPNTEGVCWALF